MAQIFLILFCVPFTHATNYWPADSDGTVTIPYYFDNSIPAGDARRNAFREASEMYRRYTCIDWTETSKVDAPGSIVKVLDTRDGCISDIGRKLEAVNEIDIESSCKKIGTMIHEMGHTLGMEHTQTRPDRDNFVYIWSQNIKPEQVEQFDMKRQNVHGLPYDHLSMMNYGYSHGSVNDRFTITPRNPLVFFGMESDKTEFRWSDIAWINRQYKCGDKFLKTCADLNCQNGGYVGKNCKCSCPEGTEGELCDFKTGNFYDYSKILKCGGVISKPGWVRSNGLKDCAFHVKAPQCHNIEITIKSAYLPSRSCGNNFLNLQLSENKYGNHYCGQRDVPINTVMSSEGPEAAIYYKTSEKGFPGFKAYLDFVADKKWPDVTSTPLQDSTSEDISLSGPCTIQEIEDKKYVYSTPNFPSRVACFAHCGMTFEKDEGNKMIVYKVVIEKQLKRKENIQVKDPVSLSKRMGNKLYVTYVLLPVSLNLTGSDHPGEGFRATWEPAVDLPHPCNGQVIALTTEKQATLKNPLMNFKGPGAKCIFTVVTLEGRHVRLLLSNGGKQLIFLRDKKNEKFIQLTQQNYKSKQNMLDLYIVPGKSPQDWVMEFSME